MVRWKKMKKIFKIKNFILSMVMVLVLFSIILSGAYTMAIALGIMLCFMQMVIIEHKIHDFANVFLQTLLKVAEEYAKTR